MQMDYLIGHHSLAISGYLSWHYMAYPKIHSFVHHLQDHQRHYYEITDRQHYHFTCLSCARVIEFDTPFISQIQQELADEMGVHVKQARLYLEGYCAVCVDEAKGMQPHAGTSI